MARPGSASETYRVCSASAPAFSTSIRPSTTGVTSAAMIQPARIAQARHAYLRSAMLARMTATATISASQASMPGGADAAYCASSVGSHCHGPPSAPGTNVFFSSSPVKLNAWLAPERVGCAVDVCSACESTARYAATISTSSTQDFQYLARHRPIARGQGPSIRKPEVTPNSTSGRISAFSKKSSPKTSQAAAEIAWRKRPVRT